MRSVNSGIHQLLVVCALGAGLSLTASAQSSSPTVTRTPGNYSRQTTVTGASGKTAAYQRNATWGNGAYTDTRSFTGVNGGARTGTVTRSGGIVSKTVTGRRGNSRTYSRPARFHR